MVDYDLSKKVNLGRERKIVITVLNKKGDKIPPLAIYVGRPKLLGNPFTHLSYVGERTGMTLVSSREEAVQRYEQWLREELSERGWSETSRAYNQLKKVYQRTGNVSLVCWCAPQACHADVLKRMLEE